MDDHTRQAARALIINHGGLETTHYKDSIDDDLDWFASRLQAQQPAFKTLEPTRQAALLDMAFDLGLIGLVKLKPLWVALNAYNWNGAAEAILESKWAMQAGVRAVDNARIMRMGKI